MPFPLAPSPTCAVGSGPQQGLENCSPFHVTLREKGRAGAGGGHTEAALSSETALDSESRPSAGCGETDVSRGPAQPGKRGDRPAVQGQRERPCRFFKASAWRREGSDAEPPACRRNGGGRGSRGRLPWRFGDGPDRRDKGERAHRKLGGHGNHRETGKAYSTRKLNVDLGLGYA